MLYIYHLDPVEGGDCSLIQKFLLAEEPALSLPGTSDKNFISPKKIILKKNSIELSHPVFLKPPRRANYS